MAERHARAAEPEQPSKPGKQRPAQARVVAVVVVVALAIIGVVQNSQNVTVRFLTFTGHVGLIWTIIVCLILGGVLGYVAGRRGRLRRRSPGRSAEK
jgi:uncharacterized integral membrane protein